MPKRVQTTFKGLSLLPADIAHPPVVAEYLRRIPVTTIEQALTLWADENRDLSATIDQLCGSGEFSKLLLDCEKSFGMPTSLPPRFWILTKVHSIMGIVLPAIVIDVENSSRVKDA